MRFDRVEEEPAGVLERGVRVVDGAVTRRALAFVDGVDDQRIVAEEDHEDAGVPGLRRRSEVAMELGERDAALRGVPDPYASFGHRYFSIPGSPSMLFAFFSLR
jgi:hypothetical protein